MKQQPHLGVSLPGSVLEVPNVAPDPQGDTTTPRGITHSPFDNEKQKLVSVVTK